MISELASGSVNYPAIIIMNISQWLRKVNSRIFRKRNSHESYPSETSEGVGDMTMYVGLSYFFYMLSEINSSER